MTRALIADPFGGRSHEEWIGSSPDAKVPDRIRDRVFMRAGGKCHLSGRKIMVGDRWELEHIKPLAMGGQHREANLAPALVEAHREKTADENSARSKADRIRRKANKTWPPTKRPLQSRGFPKSREVQP